MIRSDVQVLVDSVLEGLHASDLVLFIQSFGIPTASMTKLLMALDKMVTVDLAGIQRATKDAKMDKDYMGTLISVRHQLGAKGGEKFAGALGLTINSTAIEECQTVDESRRIPELTPPVIPPRSTAMIPPGQATHTIHLLLIL